MPFSDLFEQTFRGFDEVEHEVDPNGDVWVSLKLDANLIQGVRDPLDLIIKMAPKWPPKYQVGRYADRAPMRRRLALVEQEQRRERRR